MASATSISAAFPPGLLAAPPATQPFEGFPSLVLDREVSSIGAPYLTCNEEGQDSTLATLATTVLPNDRAVHFGFSVPGFNLDVIAQTKPARAVICDIDPQVIKLYEAYKQALEECERSIDFAEALNAYIKGKSFMSFDFKDELDRKGCWFSTQTSYNTIRQMHRDGKIYFGYLNLADTQGVFDQIGNWIQTKNLYVQTLYISNIFVWLKKANRETLTQGSLNIQKLIDHRTHTIHAFSPEGNEKKLLVQEVVEGMAAKDIAETIWNLNYVALPPQRNFRRQGPPPVLRLTLSGDEA